MVVAVALALEYELRVVPGEEQDGVERLDVFRAGLTVEFGQPVAGCCIVGDESAVVLGAVQLEHVEGLGIGTPGNVGEVSVGGVASVQIVGLLCLQVVDADGDLVAGHAGHRVLVGDVGGLPWEDVDLRVVGHHRLVHAVEGKLLAVGTPEDAFLNAELVAVDGLSVDDFARAVGGELPLVACGIAYTELIVLDVGYRARLAVPVAELLALAVLAPLRAVLPEVVEDALLAVGKQY